MKNELQILIEEVQKEYEYLENELINCLKDWDFEGAEAFKKPLFYIKEKLRILRNLDNPDYDEIFTLRRRIEHLGKSESKDEFSGFLNQWKKYKIKECEEKLLNLENKERRSYYDSDELIICLEKILGDEIRTFEFNIESEGVVFETSKYDSILKIEIYRTDEYSLDHTTSRKGINELKRMGFSLNEKTAFKEIKGFNKKSILSIIELFSRIIFEVFAFYGDKKGKIVLKR